MNSLDEKGFRYVNAKMNYKVDDHKFALTFDVDVNGEPPDKSGLIVLVVDYLAAVLEKADIDPQIFFEEIVRARRMN